MESWSKAKIPWRPAAQTKLTPHPANASLGMSCEHKFHSNSKPETEVKKSGFVFFCISQKRCDCGTFRKHQPLFHGLGMQKNLSSKGLIPVSFKMDAFSGSLIDAFNSFHFPFLFS